MGRWAQVNRLDAASCALRGPDRDDGRRRIVEVTALGRSCRAEAFAKLTAILESVITDLNDEAATAALTFLASVLPTGRPIRPRRCLAMGHTR